VITKIFTHIKVKEIEISNVFSQTNHVQIHVNHKTEVTSYMLLIESGVLVDSLCTVYCRLIHAKVLITIHFITDFIYHCSKIFQRFLV